MTVESAPLLPDAEALVYAYLSTHAGVDALVAGRVYSAVPEAPTYPLVTLTRVGGAPTLAYWVDSPRVQLDAWGRSKGEASDLARTLVAACAELAGRTVPGHGVVTSVLPVLGPLWQPDTEVAPPRPRYLVDVQLTTHPER